MSRQLPQPSLPAPEPKTSIEQLSGWRGAPTFEVTLPMSVAPPRPPIRPRRCSCLGGISSIQVLILLAHFKKVISKVSL